MWSTVSSDRKTNGSVIPNRLKSFSRGAVAFAGFFAFEVSAAAQTAATMPALRTAPRADLPAGLELVVAAAAPLVNHPMMGCLDDRGRLFIGDAAGINLDKAGLEAQAPNRVLLLEDTNGDGVFDTSTVFADKMTFPTGGVWLNGSLYVASPPGIWKLRDTDNDGVADQREMLIGGFDYTSNAADIHGPYLHRMAVSFGPTVSKGIASCKRTVRSCMKDAHTGYGRQIPTAPTFSGTH